MSVLLSVIGGAAAIIATRSASQAISNIAKRVLPFNKSRDAKRMDYQASISKEQQEMNLRFQERMQERGFQDKREIARITALWQRQTTFLANIQNCQNAMNNKLFDDALRHFPLNIPPLVMLQNAGMSTASITGKVMDDPFTKWILDSLESDAIQERAFYSQFDTNLKSSPIALSVFVTPLQVDARVAAKEKIASIVWDNTYQNLESLFIKEYNRIGERPVIFYPGAWNLNAKPGMHASEILYFFTKGMPVIVLEPRFDGKQLRLMFSCWGVGLLSDEHLRQEITYEIDWNELILPAMYERSKKGLQKLNKIGLLPPTLNELKKRLDHNVTLYESLKEAGNIKTEILCDDISKLFYFTNEDYSEISDMISNSLGMVLTVISDIHHREARAIEPAFPRLKDKYFAGMLKNIGEQEIALLNDAFAEVYNPEILQANTHDNVVTSNVKEPMFKTYKRTILEDLREE